MAEVSHEGYMTALAEMFGGDYDRSDCRLEEALKKLAIAMVSHKPHMCSLCLIRQGSQGVEGDVIVVT